MPSVKQFHFNLFQENTYVLWDESMQGVVVDAGCCVPAENKKLLSFIDENGICIKAVWLTHAHFDHIAGVSLVCQKYSVKAYMSPLDAEMFQVNTRLVETYGIPVPDMDFPRVDIKEGDTLSFGNTSFTVLATPGHTPGGVCFYCKEADMLFTGDTMFAGTIGRTDLPGGDLDKLLEGIGEKILPLPSQTAIYPGHGIDSDLGYEISHNPFLEPLLKGKDYDPNSDIDPISLQGDYK